MELTDRKIDKTALLHDEVTGTNKKRTRPLQGSSLKNPAIYSKTALAVYKRRRFHVERMTGFDTGDRGIPCAAKFHIFYS